MNYYLFVNYITGLCIIQHYSPKSPKVATNGSETPSRKNSIRTTNSEILKLVSLIFSSKLLPFMFIIINFKYKLRYKINKIYL